MKWSSRSITLQWIKTQYDKGGVSLEHRLQRKAGCWSPKEKSEFIETLIRLEIPITSCYCIDDGGILYIIEGVQRFSTCISFLNDEFSLSRSIPDAILGITEDGKRVERTFKLAGKKFSKLEEEVQDALLAAQIDIVEITKYEDWEVKELFRRINAGHTLSGKQLRVTKESEEVGSKVLELSRHEAFTKMLTTRQIIAANDKELVRQALMLIDHSSGHPLASFADADMDKFITERSDEVMQYAYSGLKSALDKLNVILDEPEFFVTTTNRWGKEVTKRVLIPITSIPMILLCAYKQAKNKKDFEGLKQELKEFLRTLDSNEEYKNTMQKGTSNNANVTFRYNYWAEKLKKM
ncbi:DUF262 domain-containing protein [Lachnospiraceae bacterium 47-T17]